MENIQLEYRPIHFLNYFRKINGTFPSTFDELKPKQLIAIAGLINQTISEKYFLHIMTGIRKFKIRSLEFYYCYQLMKLFEPFTEIKPYHSFIIEDVLTSTTLFGSPKPKLAGMTFGQFIFVESYFSSYQTDKNPGDLHKFVASLYLPELHGFDENKIPEDALSFSKVKPEILDAIVINYVLVKEWLGLAYPLVFEREDDTETAKPKKLNKSNNDSGWIKVFESIVGDDIINQDKYALLPVHTVLRWMTNKIKENRKQR